MQTITLEELIESQKEIQIKIGSPMGEGQTAIKENAIALAVEAMEVMNEVNWKLWRKTEFVVDKHKIKAEIADCFLFCLNLVNEAHISPEEMVEEILHKQIDAINRHQ